MHPSNKKIFDKKELEQIEVMSCIRLKQEHIARILGVSKSTFARRMKEDDAVREAYERGLAKSSYTLHSKAYELAKSGKVPAFLMFYLRCQEGWRENKELFNEDENSYPDVA